MSEDLLKRAEEEIVVLKSAVESLGYLRIEEDNALKFIALIQELIDKLKGDAEDVDELKRWRKSHYEKGSDYNPDYCAARDALKEHLVYCSRRAERLESDKLAKLLEKVVKFANEGAKKRMNDINLTFGSDEKNNFKHDDTFVKFSQCAIHAQAAINVIKGDDNDS